MSLETTYQNDFKPYNVRYGFLHYTANNQDPNAYNWYLRGRDDVPWRRHVAAVDINGPNTVEWISTPNTEYLEPQMFKGDQYSEFESMKKVYERDLNENSTANVQGARNNYYHKVRYSPWQFIYPEKSKVMQNQGDYFQRTSPQNAHNVKFN